MADYKEWDRLVNLFRPSSKSPNIAKAFDQAKIHSVRQDAELTALAALVSATTPPPVVTGAMDRATMTWPGATILRNDSADQVDPLGGLWGELAAVSSARHVHKTTGGCPYPRGDGSAQSNTKYREMTVVDGDDFFGERCELGRNEYRFGENTGSGTTGTFVLVDEGQRRVIFWSQRYGSGFTSALSGWQTVFQLKHTQPYADSLPNTPGEEPALEIQVWNNLFRFHSFGTSIWTTAAPPNGSWIRCALDVTGSYDPTLGRAQVFVDNDADGDWLDADEMSSVFTMRTLAQVEAQAGSPPGRAVGESLPGHIRIGIYHNASVYGTTVVDVDNVQACSVS